MVPHIHIPPMLIDISIYAHVGLDNLMTEKFYWQDEGTERECRLQYLSKRQQLTLGSKKYDSPDLPDGTPAVYLDGDQQ